MIRRRSPDLRGAPHPEYEPPLPISAQNSSLHILLSPDFPPLTKRSIFMMGAR